MGKGINFRVYHRAIQSINFARRSFFNYESLFREHVNEERTFGLYEKIKDNIMQKNAVKLKTSTPIS